MFQMDFIVDLNFHCFSESITDALILEQVGSTVKRRGAFALILYSIEWVRFSNNAVGQYSQK